jgi:outer membrane protein W
MNFSALTRTGFAVALSAVLASMAAPVGAEEQGSGMFSQVSSSFRDRLFFRLNYIYANVKTTSGNTYDVTGPVIGANDIATYLAPGNHSGTSQGMGKAALNDGGTYLSPYYVTTGPTSLRQGVIYNTNNSSGVSYQFTQGIQQDLALGFTNESIGLGTPPGVKAKSEDSAATPALSLGYFFTDDYAWFVEAYLLAAPLKVNVRGDGINGQGQPLGINGVDIIKTKLLPPTAILGYYFGSKNDSIRPFLGVGGSYAMFFDVRATDALNDYVGGRSAGDTTVHLKNATGFGPFMGVRTSLSDEWHFNLSIGKLRYKTEATITTNNTTLTSNSAVIREFGPYITNLNTNGASVIEDSLRTSTNAAARNSGAATQGVVTALMCDLAAAKYHNDNCNLGTFVRKQNTVLDSTMFMFSIGRTF